MVTTTVDIPGYRERKHRPHFSEKKKVIVKLGGLTADKRIRAT